MKIIAGRQFYEQFHSRVAEILPEANWVLFEPPERWSTRPDGAKCAVLIGDAYCQSYKETLLQIPSLQWVHTENTGVDEAWYHHLLSKGIRLTKSPGANAPEVVEYVFAVLLQRIKRLEVLKNQQRNHIWRRVQLQSLSGQTMLIVGLGAIGSRLARMASAFDMHVIGLRRRKDHVPGVNEQGDLEALEGFLSRADVVVLSVPLNDETRHLLNGHALQFMKDSATLINVSRGAVLDIDAMKTKLATTPTLSVCLDVMPTEPWPPEDSLWDMDNVFISPHLAWSGPNFRERAGCIWLDNLRRFRTGESLLHEVSASQ